jgi:ATP-binding cassette subfamily B protein
MAHIVDDGVKGADVGLIFHYGLIMLGIAAVGALGAVMRNFFSSYTSQTVAREIRGDMYRKVQALSFENVDRLQPASIITRITNDVSQIQVFINGSMRIMVKAPITCVGATALIILQTPAQIPMMVVILVIAAGLIAANMKVGYPRFGALQRKLDRLNDVSREFLSSGRVVKAVGAEGRESRKFDAAAEELADAGVSAMRVTAVFSPLINLTVNLGIVVLLWLSQGQNSAEIGRLMASVNYMTQVLFALGMVSNILNTAVRATASAERVGEVLSETPAQKQPDRPLCPRFEGGIAFEAVSFAYAGAARESLSHVSFHVEPGETVGVIGPTGSGKSTLVGLVPRFYDATGGRVLIDGADVTQIDEKALRTAIAVVPQKALLFSGTIMDNLRWGRENATDNEVRKAARVACADDFIASSENGYQTLLGQGGVNLSGGQKQRLALARALVRNPRILILDDCTSALDAATETAVLGGLREQFKGTTVLLISQRISTVMRADRILCLENGSLQGCGTHAELMAACPTYRAIYASQIGGDRDGRQA